VLNARCCASAAQRAARSDPSLGKGRRARGDGILSWMAEFFLDDGVFLEP